MATEQPPKVNMTPIILGVLTLLGVLATAVFGNWDKLTGDSPNRRSRRPLPQRL